MHKLTRIWSAEATSSWFLCPSNMTPSFSLFLFPSFFLLYFLSTSLFSLTSSLDSFWWYEKPGLPGVPGVLIATGIPCFLGSFMNSARKYIFMLFCIYLNLLYIFLCCMWAYDVHMWYNFLMQEIFYLKLIHRSSKMNQYAYGQLSQKNKNMRTRVMIECWRM